MPSTLNQWCAPEVILAVTDLLDAEPLQFHAIQHALQSRAKVLLVYVDSSRPKGGFSNHGQSRARSAPSIQVVSEAVERMARQIRWCGIACEPIVVRGLRPDEVPAIAKSFCADRVLVSAPAGSPGQMRNSETSVEQMICRLDLPIFVVQRILPIVPRYQRPSRRITFVPSLHANNEIPLAFASRLARENSSRLTILSIFPNAEEDIKGTDRPQADLATHLPAASLREAKLLCPVEMLRRNGDLATEVLKFDFCINQDYVILVPPRAMEATDFELREIRETICRAHCPVIVLNPHTDTLNSSHLKSKELVQVIES